jgi:DnaJ-class molecular chaperone
MAKVVEAVKKAVTKKPKEVEVKKVEVDCADCSGRGLLDAHNLCVVCDGSGKVTS